MSVTTQTETRLAHALIRHPDTRNRGSYHAAVKISPFLWRTACGRDFGLDSHAFYTADAHRILKNPDAPLCAGCNRVGDSVSDSYQPGTDLVRA